MCRSYSSFRRLHHVETNDSVNLSPPAMLAHCAVGTVNDMHRSILKVDCDRKILSCVLLRYLRAALVFEASIADPLRPALAEVAMFS